MIDFLIDFNGILWFELIQSHYQLSKVQFLSHSQRNRATCVHTHTYDSIWIETVGYRAMSQTNVRFYKLETNWIGI